MSDHPHIVIDCPTQADGKRDIEATITGIDSQDQAVIILLTVVEQLTGISTNGYVDMVDAARRFAAREEAAA